MPEALLIEGELRAAQGRTDEAQALWQALARRGGCAAVGADAGERAAGERRRSRADVRLDKQRAKRSPDVPFGDFV